MEPKRESRKRHTQICQMILTKGQRQVNDKMMLLTNYVGETNIHKQRKKELSPAPYALYKITSKWALGWNVKHKPIKQLEKIKRENLCDTTLSYKLLDTKPKARSIKEKNW